MVIPVDGWVNIKYISYFHCVLSLLLFLSFIDLNELSLLFVVSYRWSQSLLSPLCRCVYCTVLFYLLMYAVVVLVVPVTLVVCVIKWHQKRSKWLLVTLILFWLSVNDGKSLGHRDGSLLYSCNVLKLSKIALFSTFCPDIHVSLMKLTIGEFTALNT